MFLTTTAGMVSLKAGIANKSVLFVDIYPVVPLLLSSVSIVRSHSQMTVSSSAQADEARSISTIVLMTFIASPHFGEHIRPTSFFNSADIGNAAINAYTYRDIRDKGARSLPVRWLLSRLRGDT